MLPDLAARLASELSLSDDEPARRQPRRRKYLVATIVAACLVPLFIAGFLWTQSNPSPRVFEPKGRWPASEPGAPVSPIPKDAPAQGVAKAEASKAEDAAVAEEAAPKPGPPSLPHLEKVAEAAGNPGEKAGDKAKTSATEPSKPVVDASRSREPVIVVCALPEIPKSQFATKVPQQRELDLPEDVDDSFDLLNARQFRQKPSTAALDLGHRDQDQ